MAKTRVSSFKEALDKTLLTATRGIEGQGLGKVKKQFINPEMEDLLSGIHYCLTEAKNFRQLEKILIVLNLATSSEAGANGLADKLKNASFAVAVPEDFKKLMEPQTEETSNCCLPYKRRQIDPFIINRRSIQDAFSQVMLEYEIPTIVGNKGPHSNIVNTLESLIKDDAIDLGPRRTL